MMEHSPTDRELIGEARDHLLLTISVIEGYDSAHISNEAELDQALDSFVAWAGDWLRRTRP